MEQYTCTHLNRYKVTSVFAVPVTHSKNKAIHFHLICPVRKGLGKIRKKYLISNELYHRIF